MRTTNISYNLSTENLDCQIIKELTNLFKKKEIWILLENVSKDKIKEITTTKAFLIKDAYYLKVKSKNICNIIEKILNLNWNFQIFSFKKQYNELTSEIIKTKEKIYLIDFYSIGRLNISFSTKEFDEKLMRTNISKIIEKINIREKQREKIKKGMCILFILTVITFFIIGNIISEISYNTEYMWLMWLCLPIPILSIVLGLKFQKMRVNCQKNVISGYIVAFLLLLFGSFTFIFPNEDYQQILKMENIINIQLPDEGVYTITKWSNNSLKCNILHEIHFKNKRFSEEEIERSKTWLKKENIDNNLEILISPLITCDLNEKCYYSIYIEETEKYNTVPTEDGIYHIFAMMYNQDMNCLKISEYNYEIKKN